eukprot:7396051-Karenia_brevis.AAC.1
MPLGVWIWQPVQVQVRYLTARKFMSHRKSIASSRRSGIRTVCCKHRIASIEKGIAYRSDSCQSIENKIVSDRLGFESLAWAGRRPLSREVLKDCCRQICKRVLCRLRCSSECCEDLTKIEQSNGKGTVQVEWPAPES